MFLFVPEHGRHRFANGQMGPPSIPPTRGACRFVFRFARIRWFYIAASTPRGTSWTMTFAMRTRNCPRCGTSKTRLAPRKGVTDRLLSTLTIYPVRCQLCAHRFTTFLGHIKTNPRRNYDRVSVQYPAQVRPTHDPSQSIVVEGMLSNLSLRGCRVRTNQRIPMGCQVMLEFQSAEYDDPIIIDGAIVRSRCAQGIGLRFSSFLRSEERRIRRILDLRLPDHAS